MKKTCPRGFIALIFAAASTLSFGAPGIGPDAIALSSGTAGANGTVSLSLVLTSPSGSEPASLQWTLTYPAANVISISATAGTALAAAGKTLNCSGGAGTYTCLASGMNAGIISNGTVAAVNLVLALGVSTTAIGISNNVASSAAGGAIVLNATGGTVTGGAALPTVSSVSCVPTSLNSAGKSTCTATLSGAAPTGGAAVTLSSNSTVLTVPASVTIAAGATSTTFTATAGTLASNQSATVTATYNGSSKTATISLVAPLSVSSLACSPTSLGQNASSTCTVTLTQAAATGGAAVTLSDTSTALTVPASVTVSAGATTGTFNATTTTLASNQSATVTATYNGSSKTATISLVAPVTVSSLACTPASLGPSTSSTCTVTLSNNAPTGGANVVLSTVNSLLTAPPSVTVGAGTNSTTFTLQAASFVGTQSGSVTASYNRSSQSVTIFLTASALVSSLVCSPTGVMSGATSSCTITLSQAPAANTTIALSSTSTLITVPASVVINAGSTTKAFSATIGTISADSSGKVTATFGTSSQSATFTLWSTPTLSSLTCNPTSVSAGTGTTCVITLSKAAGSIAVSVGSGSTGVTVPPIVTVPQGSASIGFPVTIATSVSGWVVVTATLNGVSKLVLFSVTAAKTGSTQTTQVTLKQLSCAPKSLTVGSRGICRVTLDPVESSGPAELQLSSSSGSIRLPGKAITRRGQSMLEFQVDAVSSGEDVVVSANTGSDVVTDTVTVATDRPASIRVSGRRSVKYGTELRFQVPTVDPGATVSTGGLPAGALFDANAREFRWTPDSTQIGTHEIKFSAADAVGGSAVASVTVQVDSGGPVVTGVVNAASRVREAACSPGAIASIEGRWLTNGTTVTDATGSSLELAGTKVWANGAAVPILSASDMELNVLCPDSAPGSEVEFVVQTDHGIADPVRTQTLSASPGLFSLDGSGKGQGRALLRDTNNMAMIRNYQTASQPVAAGDQVISYGTGLGNLSNISVRVGESEVTPAAVTPVPGRPGMYQICFTIPSTAAGTDIPLLLSGNLPEGIRVSTNTINIAIEGSDW